MKQINKDFCFESKSAWTVLPLLIAVIFNIGAILSFSLLDNYISGFILFVAAGCLFASVAGHKFVLRFDSVQVLPFVDLLSSENDVVLDAGCGTGRTVIAISRVLKKGKIIAVDLFSASYFKDGGKSMLEHNLKVEGIEDKVQILEADIRNIPVGDNTFDSAVSSFAMDHLCPRRQLIPGLNEINRVLKQNGRFLVIVFAINYFTLQMGFLTPIVFHLRTSKSWHRWFEQTGFICIDEGNINGASYFLLEKA